MHAELRLTLVLLSLVPHSTGTHPVVLKRANQLGLYDLSGNVWEWCADTVSDEVHAVPADGTPCRSPGAERRLRGGCNHSWDPHCRVWWRYGIEPDFHDSCIGFRLVLGHAPSHRQ